MRISDAQCRWADLDAGLKDRAEHDPVQAGLGAGYKRLGELGMENELLREKIAGLEGGVPLVVSQISQVARDRVVYPGLLYAASE